MSVCLQRIYISTVITIKYMGTPMLQMFGDKSTYLSVGLSIMGTPDFVFV